MQDAGIVEIASSPEAYIRYLELQGDNPYYSPGNIALAMFQKSDVTQFGTREKWKSLGRSVKDSEASADPKVSLRLHLRIFALYHMGICRRCFHIRR